MVMYGQKVCGRSRPIEVGSLETLDDAEDVANVYSDEVKSRVYPAPQHTYPMPAEELQKFERFVEMERML